MNVQQITAIWLACALAGMAQAATPRAGAGRAPMPHQGPDSSFGDASPLRASSSLGTDQHGDPERHDQVLELTDCAQDPPCVPDGETSPISFPRPPLGQSGDPVSAEWLDGTGKPEAFDDDLLSTDPMGPATPDATGDNASVCVENKGGNLSGPNGSVVNGGLDGDCAEVYVQWTYRYQYTFSTCSQIKHDGGGSSTCTSVLKWGTKTKVSCVAKVCPCD